MKASLRNFIVTIFLLAFGVVVLTSKAYSHTSNITLRDIAGNWVIVQTGIVPSSGLMFAGQLIPAGSSIGSVLLWTFNADGSCARKGSVNFDGNGGELSVPLSQCKISLNSDGTGMIEVESPLAGPSVIKIIVVNRDEIAMISADSAIIASTFKRQKIRKRRHKHNYSNP